MMAEATELSLELSPRSRLDIIDVAAEIRQRFGDWVTRYRQASFCSHHTTAGYLDQRFCERLDYDSQNLERFLETFQKLFPAEAGYYHDQLHLRTELTESEKLEEPKNADAHLTFIGSGITNCVTYRVSPDLPVYFIDLDGINGSLRRKRTTTVVGFNEERKVDEHLIPIPLSNHSLDSVSLKNPSLGIFEELHHYLRKYDIATGRIDLSLEGGENHAGLTVNEYETLLMRHDLMEVLQNPLRFMAERGRHMISDPRAIPSKAKGYAKYDLVQIINEFLDAAGLQESLIERLIHRFMALPAARFLRVKKSISLLVSSGENGTGRIVEGNYQSPILVQWKRAHNRTRRIKARFVRFN